MVDSRRPNAANPDQVKEAERKERQRIRQEIDDFLWLMSDKRGRRFMWRLLSVCRIFSSSFVANAMTVSFNEGGRNVGLKYLADINRHCAEKYTLMANENRAEQAHDAKEQSNDD